MKEISSLKLEEIFTWKDNYCMGGVYFSHANPFKYGDWSYIENVKNLLNDQNYYNSVVKKCIETSKMYDVQTTVKNCCKMYYSLF